MNPINFPESNRTYVKPDSMTDEQCGDLHVFVGVDLDGFPMILSKWELTPEELKQVNETGTVWLKVVDTGLSPVAVFTQSPFEDPIEPK